MNKTYTYIVAGIVILALVIWGIYAYHENDAKKAMQQAARQAASNNNMPTATPTPKSTPTPAVKSTGAQTPAANLSYDAAVKAYPERFQFSKSCQGTPATISTRKGTPIMLDNRDSVAHIIKADTETFKLPAYNYAVFYPEVLGNIVVDCDSRPSVTLNIEK